MTIVFEGLDFVVSSVQECISNSLLKYTLATDAAVGGWTGSGPSSILPASGESEETKCVEDRCVGERGDTTPATPCRDVMEFFFVSVGVDARRLMLSELELLLSRLAGEDVVLGEDVVGC
jgi:hypothetical protein